MHLDRSKPVRCGLQVFLSLLVVTSWFVSLSSGVASASDVGVERKQAICKAIIDALDRLPADTSAYSWPELIRMDGLTRPDWRKLDYRKYMNLIRYTIVLANGTDGDTSTDAQRKIWEKVGPSVLHQMETGNFEMDVASIPHGVKQKPLILYRFTHQMQEEYLTLNSADKIVNGWYNIEAYSEQKTEPLFVINPNPYISGDVILLDEIPLYISSYPGGSSVSLMHFADEIWGSAPPPDPIELICPTVVPRHAR